MKKLLEIYSYGNNDGLLEEVVKILDKDGVIAIPTDAGYVLACKMKSKKAIEKIHKIRNFDDKNNFTLMCRDLSEISEYAKIDNSAYRVLKRNTPASFTFILLATKNVSSILVTKNKKTIGIRVSEHFLPNMLVEKLGEPLVTCSFILPNDATIISDCSEVDQEVMNKIDLVIESDYCGYEPTTVVDMLEVPYKILREGAGDVDSVV